MPNDDLNLSLPDREQNAIERGSVSGWMANDHTLVLRFSSPVITMQEVTDAIAIRHDLVPKDTPFFGLIESIGTKSAEAKTRRHPPDPFARRIALIYKSSVGRMLGNAYLRIMPPKCPIRLFATREDGLTWLREAGPPVL